MRIAQAALAALALSGLFLGSCGARERVVGRHGIVSAKQPPIRIDLPRQSRFVGADHWVLFGVADCALYFFAEADRDGIIRRYYWVQFEGYVLSRPELHYSSTLPVVQIGGLDFHVRARFGPGAGEVPKSGSELEHLLPLLAAKGLKLPSGIVNVRFQHFYEDRRKELMIIYGEDMALSGVTLPELQDGVQPGARWPAVEAEIIARARQRLRVGRP